MKKIITFLIFILSLNLFSQEVITIKGKLFFSDEFYENFSNLLVKIDGADEYIKIEEDGNFEILTSIKRDKYKLIFSYGNIKFKEYTYKFEWTKRDRSKSISLADKCEINKSIAQDDFRKKRKFKLYILNKLDTLILSKKDERFQRKTNSEFVKINYNNLNKFECYSDYNQRVFFILSLTGKIKFLEKLREDVIGYNYRYNR
jgi:hypothetical protein